MGFQMLLRELQNLDGILLSNAQQVVLVIIRTSATPQIALETINNNVNIYTAAKMLANIGVVDLKNGATITQEGERFLTEYNLVDETGQLTPNATQLLSKFPELATVG